ncbi:MAG: hypothetical protein K2P84_00720 [Undibacterium sp.]|nr:hypothetical protein [Undibacterium sp.]
MKSGTPKSLWSASAEELYALFRRGKDATNPKEQFLAHRALSYCLPVVMNWQYSDIGSKANQLSVWESRRELQTRCKLFFQTSPNELRAKLKSLRSSLDNSPAPINPESLELSRQETNADSIQKVRQAILNSLESDGSDALLWIGSSLGSWLEFASKHNQYRILLDPKLQDSEHIVEVMLIAMCRSGYACEKNSLAYLELCGTMGQCGESIPHQILQNLPSETQRQQTEKQAQLIADIIKSRQYSLLGLEGSKLDPQLKK